MAAPPPGFIDGLTIEVPGVGDDGSVLKADGAYEDGGFRISDQGLSLVISDQAGDTAKRLGGKSRRTGDVRFSDDDPHAPPQEPERSASITRAARPRASTDLDAARRQRRHPSQDRSRGRHGRGEATGGGRRKKDKKKQKKKDKASSTEPSPPRNATLHPNGPGNFLSASHAGNVNPFGSDADDSSVMITRPLRRAASAQTNTHGSASGRVTSFPGSAAPDAWFDTGGGGGGSPSSPTDSDGTGERTAAALAQNETQQVLPSPAGEIVAMGDLIDVGILGSGSFGVVKLVEHARSGEQFALKVLQAVDLDDVVARRQVLMEISALFSCACPYVVRFYGAFFVDRRINLCLEFMDGGSLREVCDTVGWIPEDILALIARAVLRALHYLHSKRRILHRDVKPSNILVNTVGETKLCDFGVSGNIAHSLAAANTVVGTVAYMSPERILSQPYDALSDVWSLGITLVELATGHYPYGADEFATVRPGAVDRAGGRAGFFSLLGLITESPTPTLDANAFSPAFRAFVEDGMLRADPSERWSVRSLLDHDFVAGEVSESQSNDEARVRAWVLGTDPVRRQWDKRDKAEGSAERSAGVTPKSATAPHPPANKERDQPAASDLGPGAPGINRSGSTAKRAKKDRRGSRRHNPSRTPSATALGASNGDDTTPTNERPPRPELVFFA